MKEGVRCCCQNDENLSKKGRFLLLFWLKLPAVFFRKQAVLAFKGGGEFTLTVITNLARDIGDGQPGFGQQLRSTLHAMLLDMRGQRISIHRFKDRFQCGGVHVKLPGECFDGNLFTQMLQQILVNLVNEVDLIGTAVAEQFRLLGAGDAHGLLNHMMQQVGNFTLGGPVKDFFSIAAADDEPGIPQRAEMMGYRGTGYAEHGGNVDHAFLAVAEHPENAQPGRIAQLAKDVRNDRKFLDTRKRLAEKEAVFMVGVMMGQRNVRHDEISFGPFGSVFLPIGRDWRYALAFRKMIQYTADTTNKQVFNC